MADTSKMLRHAIRNIPDYPRKGVVFRDLTTLWKNSLLLQKTTDMLAARYSRRRLDKIVGVEARGLIVGSALAYKLGLGFVPARKKGKLPGEKLTISYQLEYGEEVLEMHKDAIEPKERVLIVDDLLATGGTSLATAKLVKTLGGHVVGFAFIAELVFLGGRKKLEGYEVTSLVRYPSETD